MKEPRIPLSLVFISVGLVILLAVALIYLFTPSAPPGLPALLPLATIPDIPPTTTSRFIPPTSTPLANSFDSTIALLPESPLLQTAFPSEATADTAPRAFRDPVPGQPIRLVIPKLNIDAPIWEVGLEIVTLDEKSFFQWSVPTTYAAGWHNSSALLGQQGNTVLNGHHNVYGEIFRDVINLEVGDTIILHDKEQSFTYQVTEQQLLLERGQTVRVRQTNAHWIEPTSDERITLVTCWPYTDNAYRLIVVAHPAGAEN